MNGLIIIRNGTADLTKDTMLELLYIEQTKKELKAQEEKLRKAILEEMEANNLIKLENGAVSISYVAASDREKFDKDKFQTDNPDLYDQYVTMTTVKPQIRVKVK